MNLQYVTFFIAAWLGLSSSSLAQLSWEQRQVDVHPSAEATSAFADFPFQNTSSYPVTILEVKPSCGCTTTQLDKTTYSPGEKGVIRANYDIGSRVGFQQKTILVRTDSDQEQFAQLALRVYVPELIIPEPTLASFKIENNDSPILIHLTAGTKEPVRVLGVRSSDARIFAKLIPVAVGMSYDVQISITDSSEPLRPSVRVETDSRVQKFRVYHIPVVVGDIPLPKRSAASMSAASAAADLSATPETLPAEAGDRSVKPVTEP